MMSPVPLMIRWRRVARIWVRHRHTDSAAALAFYALISLTPLLLFGVTAAGLVMGEKTAHGELERQMTTVIGPEATQMVESILQSARIAPSSQPAAFGLAMVTLLYAGSHVLTRLQRSLNVVNGLDPAALTGGLKGHLFARALAGLLILLFGLLLVAGSLLEGAVGYIRRQVEAPWLARFDLQQELRWSITYLLLTLAFVLVLKILPKKRPRLFHAVVGAGVGAFAGVSLKGLLDFYLSQTLWASLVGSGVTVLLFLIWLFFSIQAFLAGAEITAWLERRWKKRRSRLT